MIEEKHNLLCDTSARTKITFYYFSHNRVFGHKVVSRDG